MRAEAQAHADTINEALELLRRFLDWDRALRRLDELNARVEDQALWNDPKAAQAVMRERRRLEEAITATRAIESELSDTSELIEMAEAEGDAAMEADGVAALAELAARADKDKVKALLAGEADGNDTYIEVNAGAGGTESQDWAGMLSRMYSRWGERHGLKVELIDQHSGEQAGIKSATLLLKGENAYGYAKTESGVHRLVRISPYDSAARRHTSFASVWVYPVVDDNIEVEYNESDLRIDTYRASTSTPPIPRCASRISRPASWCSARTSDRSTRTRPRPITSCARDYMSANCRSARRRPMPRMPARPISAGATRSGPMCCSRTRW
jgi:peptide chain release factor 2